MSLHVMCIAADHSNDGEITASIPANVVANIGPTDNKVNIRYQCMYCQIRTCGWCGIDVHCVVINVCHLQMHRTCCGAKSFDMMGKVSQAHVAQTCVLQYKYSI